MNKADTIPDQCLDPYEQEIEDAPLGPRKPLSEERKREIETALREAGRDRKWGGARKGAGRPPKPAARRHLRLTPDADAALERLTSKKGLSLSDTVSWALLTAEKLED